MVWFHVLGTDRGGTENHIVNLDSMILAIHLVTQPPNSFALASSSAKKYYFCMELICQFNAIHIDFYLNVYENDDWLHVSLKIKITCTKLNQPLS